MNPLVEAGDIERINQALGQWRQGDVALGEGMFFLHLADLSCPLTGTSVETRQARSEEGAELGLEGVAEEVLGLMVTTQTCDVVRTCEDRSFVEVAPLVRVDVNTLEEVRKLRRPRFAYVPDLVAQRLVADLDRTMSVEKAVVAGWTRKPGWQRDEEGRAIAEALARKRARFAFPDDFVSAASALREHLKKQHNRNNSEGEHLKALREIRIEASPSWEARNVALRFWFIKEDEPQGQTPRWDEHVEVWR